MVCRCKKVRLINKCQCLRPRCSRFLHAWKDLLEIPEEIFENVTDMTYGPVLTLGWHTYLCFDWPSPGGNKATSFSQGPQQFLEVKGHQVHVERAMSAVDWVTLKDLFEVLGPVIRDLALNLHRVTKCGICFHRIKCAYFFCSVWCTYDDDLCSSVEWIDRNR